MKPNTVLGIGLLGSALVLSQLRGPIRTWRFLPAGLAVLLGAVTLAEYICGWDAGIDQLLYFGGTLAGGTYPGRPAFLTAVLLLLLGAGLLGTQSHGPQSLRTACALASLLMTWTLLNSYLFGHSAFPGKLPFGSITGQAAMAFFLIAIGTLASQPAQWPMRTVFAPGLGGTVCRWLMPAAVLSPPLLGWILSDPTTLKDSHAALHWALYSVCSSAGSTGLILILARRIEILDAERTAATLMSRHDPLTGIANRRAFDDFLVESFNRARRYDRPLSLLSIDLDNFKSYNDTFGHPAGDAVLKAVAETFAQLARDTDLAARIGGEEFAVVLPETATEGASALAERMRAGVAALKLPRVVTISVGIASLDPATESAAALLEESDAALYEAKRGGRNRVVVSARPLQSRIQ
jgi:diguanylate cyclase (GGDEF)-like protein